MVIYKNVITLSEKTLLLLQRVFSPGTTWCASRVRQMDVRPYYYCIEYIYICVRDTILVHIIAYIIYMYNVQRNLSAGEVAQDLHPYGFILSVNHVL